MTFLGPVCNHIGCKSRQVSCLGLKRAIFLRVFFLLPAPGTCSDNNSHLDISRHCNALLRALRHGVCSYLNTISEELESNDEFHTHSNNLLSVISGSYSVDKICQLIRTALSLQKKSPSTVFKAFDSATGRVFVANHEIPKEIWGRLIPSTLEKIRPAFYKLFKCPALLDKLLDVENAFVWDGAQSKVIVQNGVHREVVPLVSAVPSFDIEETQECIDICYSVDRFSHAYLSFGACRATELDRLSFKQSQLIFNHLRFQVRDCDDNSTTRSFAQLTLFFLHRLVQEKGRYTAAPNQVWKTTGCARRCPDMLLSSGLLCTQTSQHI